MTLAVLSYEPVELETSTAGAQLVKVVSKRSTVTAIMLAFAFVAAGSLLLFTPRSDRAARSLAPVFSLRDAATPGTTVNMVTGEPIVLVFASSWSNGVSELQQAQRIAGKSQLRVIGIAVKDSDTAAAGMAIEIARRRAQTSSSAVTSANPLAIGVDQTGSVAERYDVRNVPTVIVVDVDGRIAGRVVGSLGDASAQDSLDKFATKAAAAARDGKDLAQR